MKPSKSTIYKRMKQGMTREEAESLPVMTAQQQRKHASQSSPWRGQEIRDIR